MNHFSTQQPPLYTQLRYLLAELGTSGSLDGQQRLIVKGRFLPKSFETVLRRYVNE
jgi:translation initiation factor 2 subunit 2